MGKNLIKKIEEENREIEKIRDLLGRELGDEIFALWHEYEELKTAESTFVKALDSLEANHQSIMCDVDYWPDYYYPIALTKADKYCQHEEILNALNSEITERMKIEFKKAGIDWEK